MAGLDGEGEVTSTRSGGIGSIVVVVGLFADGIGHVGEGDVLSVGTLGDGRRQDVRHEVDRDGMWEPMIRRNMKAGRHHETHWHRNGWVNSRLIVRRMLIGDGGAWAEEIVGGGRKGRNRQRRSCRRSVTSVCSSIAAIWVSHGSVGGGGRR